MSQAFNPDSTQKNNPAYWAAAAVVADRAGDAERARIAREQLARLGYRVQPTRRMSMSRGSERVQDGVR